MSTSNYRLSKLPMMNGKCRMVIHETSAVLDHTLYLRSAVVWTFFSIMSIVSSKLTVGSILSMSDDYHYFGLDICLSVIIILTFHYSQFDQFSMFSLFSILVQTTEYNKLLADAWWQLYCLHDIINYIMTVFTDKCIKVAVHSVCLYRN